MKPTARSSSVLARAVPFVEHGKMRQVPIEEAIWRALFADALKGDVKASALIMRFIDTPASPKSGSLSDPIDEDGVLHVTLNIGDKNVIAENIRANRQYYAEHKDDDA